MLEEAYDKLRREAFEEAIADFKQVRELNPEEPEAWLGLGLALAMDLQIYPAIGIYEAFLEKWPQSVRGHLQLGLLYIKIGAISKGRGYLQTALAKHPTTLERRALEGLLREQKKLDKGRFYRPDFEALRQNALF